MGEINIAYFPTDYGELILGSFNEQLCLCDWRYRKMRDTIDQRIQKGLNAAFVEDISATIEQAKLQLTQYFNQEITSFDIPLLTVGTDFQKSVWNELQNIPYGKTDSYLGLSKKMGNEKAIRAIASANGANALSIFIPCHRIIGSDGSLIGYAGGTETKKKLLMLEGAIQENQLQLF